MTEANASYSVAVQGGTLTVHDLSHGEVAPEAPTVLLLHGITANALTWLEVARGIRGRFGSRVRILAPDLRGRAESREVVEPAGLVAHAKDVNDIACAFGGRPLLVGHSMGAFVAALAASRYPERIHAAVLVDGGLALPLPDGMTPDEAIDALIGPAMKRLSMTFADEDAYLDFWGEHPAVGPLLAGPAAASLRRYLLHDLIRSGDVCISSCIESVVRADGRDPMVNPEVAQAVSNAIDAGVPTELIWAERGLLNQTPGLYEQSRLDELGLGLPTTHLDTDHYGVLFEPLPVTTVIDAIERQLPIS